MRFSIPSQGQAAISKGANRVAGRRGEGGLTLIEILVSSTLLLFIVLGLTAMFVQAQRAFRGGVKQVDVMEGGRAALALIASDFQHVAAGSNPTVTNFMTGHVYPLTNDFYQQLKPDGWYFRTNERHDVFTVTRENRNWIGVGYTLTNISHSLCTLVRFSATNYGDDLATNILYESYQNALLANTNFHRILEGVVHFKVTALDPAGMPVNVPPLTVYHYPYNGTNLPSAVEIELGVLEPATVKQAEGMPGPAGDNFLQERPNKVHIFRQLIPIRPAVK